MPRVRSTWLVGSLDPLPAQPFTISGNPAAIASAPWYLSAADAGLSLLAGVEAEMTAAGVADASAVLLENRLVRLSGSGTFAVTWGAATTLRSLLGFAGNLSGASSYTATAVSPLLWSGGLVSRAVPTGIVGYPVEDAEITISADAQRQITTQYYTHTHDEWTWEAVHLSRYWSTSDAGGTWMRFRSEVLVPGNRVQLYEIVEEDSASAAPVALPTRVGVYRAREVPPGLGTRTAGFENANTYWRVGLPVRSSPEYT